MATQTLPEAEVQELKPTATKYIYFFGGGKGDGHGKMKDELGGKGAGLAEMTNAGLPVPPGFTIQTDACRECQGTGTRKNLRGEEETCYFCAGKGRRDCVMCGGSGYVGCAGCGGTGRKSR